MLIYYSTISIFIIIFLFSFVCIRFNNIAYNIENSINILFLFKSIIMLIFVKKNKYKYINDRNIIFLNILNILIMVIDVIFLKIYNNTIIESITYGQIYNIVMEKNNIAFVKLVILLFIINLINIFRLIYCLEPLFYFYKIYRIRYINRRRRKNRFLFGL